MDGFFKFMGTGVIVTGCLIALGMLALVVLLGLLIV